VPGGAEVTPAGRGNPKATDLRTPAERHRAVSWVSRLKRVIGIETCEQCGGKVRVIKWGDYQPRRQADLRACVISWTYVCRSGFSRDPRSNRG